MSEDDVAEGLKDLTDLGVLEEDFNPETCNQEYAIKDDRPKLLPIFKDLLKDKDDDKVNLDEVKDACKDKLSPKEVNKQMKDLVDLGAVAEEFNPETKEKEYKLDDQKTDFEEPKLLPLVKDILDNKVKDKLTKDDIAKACDGKLNPKDIEKGLKKLADQGAL